MTLSDTDLQRQTELRQALQGLAKPADFERLVAGLVEELLGVRIAIARSGFQHGADAGPAGREDRRFRLECKRYRDGAALNDRELLGEMVQALAADDAQEAWVLVATCPVGEQTVRALSRHGEDTGIPVVVIDWPDYLAAPLAALCTVNPDLVASAVSESAGTLARELASALQPALESLRRELSAWFPGTQSLRVKSHELLAEIWAKPRVSQGQLNQNAAGGARKHRVQRQSVLGELDAWWKHSPAADNPAVLVGTEGTGKTWAALDWLLNRTSNLPIVLVVPSSAVSPLSAGGTTHVKRFLGDRLHELTQRRSAEHWSRRIDLMLARPPSEGPAIVLLIDGLNQNSTIDWTVLLSALQAPPFSGRIRVLATTRQHHFEDKLGKLRALIPPATAIGMRPYDMKPGGEFDQMLALEGLDRSAIPVDLLDLARIPRIFPLVVRFRDSDPEAGLPTVHRLLWEYGRDTFRGTDSTTFTERQWREWLAGVADLARTGVERYSSSSLIDTVHRGDLSKGEVYSRLSSVVDGRFTEPTATGGFRLVPAIVQHALGAALLAHLDDRATKNPSGLDDELAQWLEPVAALDEGPEILRAAVSILVQREPPSYQSLVASPLVTAWLQSQNLPDRHRDDLFRLAPAIAEPLLDTIERSEKRAQGAALAMAVAALRSTAPGQTLVQRTTIERLCRWQRTISRDVVFFGGSAEMRASRLEHWKTRVGTDAAGPCRALGHELLLIDQHEGVREQAGFRILEAFPLAPAAPAMELAAVSHALRGRSEVWEMLKWACWLNERDSGATATALRDLSRDIASRAPEAGLQPSIAARTASLLLRLSGQPQDEEAADRLAPKDERWPSYDDYLKNPGREWFIALERRHAASVLEDETTPLWQRLRRVQTLWIDPTFEPPPTFVAVLRLAATAFPANSLDDTLGRRSEDVTFEQMEGALARCAPDLFLELTRRRLQSLETCSDDGAHWRTVRSGGLWLAAGTTEQSAARSRRLHGFKGSETDQGFAKCQLLMLEVKGLEPFEQIHTIILADPEVIASDLEYVLRAPSGDEVDRLIGTFDTGTPKQRSDLLLLLSLFRNSLSDKAWRWIRTFLESPERHLADLAFEMLAKADALRLGRELLEADWSYGPHNSFPVNHLGSQALAQAASALPFEQIVSRLAPWTLLDAARTRGEQAEDVRLAAGIFDHVLEARNVAEPDPGAILSVLARGGPPYTIRVSPRPNPEDAQDPAAALQRALDANARNDALQLAAETAKRTIEDVRKAGGPLYLRAFDTRNAASVLRHAPEVVDRWLDGLAERTTDFRRRVRLAEMVYFALCQELLVASPARGVALWRALHDEVATTYVGDAGVNELLHIVLRAPDSEPVLNLRSELISLPECNTDHGLLSFVIAARCAGRSEIVTAVIDADRNSEYVWRQRRAIVLTGFLTHAPLPTPAAWPDGPTVTSHAQCALSAARASWKEACAKHWWTQYQRTDDDAQAFSAWTLFLKAADRRSWTWMNPPTTEEGGARPARVSHAELNQQSLVRSMEKNEDKYAEQFLFRRTCKNVGPW